MSSAILTEKDCLDVVRQKLDSSECRYELVDFKLEPLGGEISGFLGVHSGLKITIKCADGGTNELKFFVKSLAATEALREFTLEGGAFSKEEKMFANIVPFLLRNGVSTIADCTPRCYLVRPSKSLVLEDLTAEGYRILNHKTSLSLNEFEVVVKALAKFHASGLILEEKLTAQRGKPYSLLNDYRNELMEAFFHRRGKLGEDFLRCVSQGSTFCIDLLGSEGELGDVDLEGFKKFVGDIVDRFPEFVRPSTKYHNTICHGDLWPANMMCKFEGDEAIHCKLVDFQFYRYTPPACDLTALLYLTTDREFRNVHAKRAVKYYYEQLKIVLSENGVEVEAYEDYLRGCEFYRTFAAAQSLVYFQLIMVPPQEMSEFFGEPEKIREILFEDRREFVAKMCGKYPAYRRRILEAVLDLKDIFKNNH